LGSGWTFPIRRSLATATTSRWLVHQNEVTDPKKDGHCLRRPTILAGNAHESGLVLVNREREGSWRQQAAWGKRQQAARSPRSGDALGDRWGFFGLRRLLGDQQPYLGSRDATLATGLRMDAKWNRLSTRLSWGST